MSLKLHITRAVIAAVAALCFAAYQYLGAGIAFYWIGLTFFVVCLFMFLRMLFLSLFKMKKVSADLLVASAMIVTWLAGEPFSGTLVAFFISLGLSVSFAIIERTRRRIAALTQERKKSVRVLQNGVVNELQVEEVRRDDIIVVPQGEMIPVDGTILEGESLMDESVVTGEPFPIFRQAGDEVISGSICLTASLKVMAAKAGDKAFLYLMGQEISEAMKVKPQIHRKADKIVQLFIPGVVLYSIVLFFVIWSVSGDVHLGLDRMAAVISIACPCAWALATPTAFAASIGSLVKSGILVRGGIPLELMGKAVNIVLDKTGTMTLAQPEIKGVESLSLPVDSVLKIAASIETEFNHPIANTIVKYAAEKSIETLKVEHAVHLPGLGVKAVVNGDEVLMGADDTLKKAGIAIPAKNEGKGRMTWVVVNGQVAGGILVKDTIRGYAAGLAHKLRDLGFRKIVMATGDNEKDEAKRVAEIVGVDDYYWGYKPADKAELVETLQKDGLTVMVGDGINDAVSLAAADIGISIGQSKADLAIKSSDIVVLREDANSLLQIIKTGKKMHKIINQNYVWAVCFNLLGISLATFTNLIPPIAAFLHHISSVFVVLNSARLVKKEL